ncbi:hypothetical protein JTB14_027252 [Gonioctena quinquepunctata]|nr:hypothetical protein JTB14_027252 [Gonioctena quinquepunctata]
MTLLKMKKIANHLLPVYQPVIFDCDINARFLNFTLDELQAASSKLKNKKAPGPGNIPPEIIKQVAIDRPEDILTVYNALANRANFPAEWKRARIVLLRKGDKPIDNPASYRPICLLDVEGKLYEKLILGRLERIDTHRRFMR